MTFNNFNATNDAFKMIVILVRILYKVETKIIRKVKICILR
ncbi:unnamed protein product [Larinioides sclopetarius]|uniref:Uncharacterized protein n=1 Tax=Larinioides sclopetarius TaxID=280406 RepID=A0AAV1ZLC3_9ARAC